MVRNMTCMGYASLSNENIQKLKTIEKEMGATLLAYEVTTYSAMNEDDLKKVKDLETELGLSLVAYKV